MPSRKTWWAIGGVAGCLVIVLVVVSTIGGLAWLGGQADEDIDTDDPIEDVSAEEPSGGEASDVPTLTWTNDRSRLTGDKAANFVPFTFRYPATWRVLEDGTGESPNFVKIERMTDEQVTIENFAVGWYSGVGADQVIGMLEPQFSGSFPNYRKIGDDTTTVDGITASGFRFEAIADTPQGSVTFWGRALAVPVSATQGVVIIMFASQLAPGVGSADDVGRAGELPVILGSFDIQS